MKLLFAVLALSLAPLSIEDAMVVLSGVSCIEELSESEIERFHHFHNHPLEINHSKRATLEESGLFSGYQAASILDYIAMNGQILSIAELAAVDGIGPRMASALSYFVVFETSSPLGSRSRQKMGSDMMGRLSYKSESLAEASKISVNSTGGSSAGLAWKEGRMTGGNVRIKTKGIVDQLILGDFNARFGQAALCWSGFTINSPSSISAFAKNPSGLSPSLSFTEGNALRGLALQLSRKSWSACSFATLDGSYALHGDYYTRTGTWGASLLASSSSIGASIDWRFTHGHFTYFGELASLIMASQTAIRAGLFYNHSYGNRGAFALRLSHQEFGSSLGFEAGGFTASADASWKPEKDTRQLKIFSQFTNTYELGPWTFTPAARFQYRCRPEDKFTQRYELRLDTELSRSLFVLHLRADVAHCQQWAGLAYLELGVKKDKSCAYLRGELFDVRKWNDRIYVYERDVPGSFNVPACYGQGYSLSLYARYGVLSLRLGTRQYPGGEKDPKLEAKLQLNFRI